MKGFFTAVVLLYLALDLGNPNLPGAISFDAEESVEIAQLPRDPLPSPPPLAVTPEPLIRLAPDRSASRLSGQHGRRASGIASAPLHAVRRLASDPADSEEG